MGIVNMIKARLGPKAAKAPPAKAPKVPPLPKFQRALIDTKDFEAGEPWRAGDEITLAVWPVPEDTAFIIPRGANLKFYLYAKATRDPVDNSGGSTEVNAVVNTPGLVETKMKKPALPSARHPEVRAYAKKGSSSDFEPVPVQAIDYDAGTVTLSVPAGENWQVIEVYYVSAQGEFRFVILREGGGIKTEVPIYNNSFGAVHSLNQHDAEERPTIPNPGLLVEGYRLALKVRSPNPIEWNDRARHFVQLDAAAIHVPGADKSELQRRAERLLRGGL